jgi:hypothetical protein
MTGSAERDGRIRPFGVLARLRAFPVWQGGLSLFGLVAFVVFVLAILHPSTLR